MFRNSIQGLERVFRTDIDPSKVVLVSGPPGSMKTSFCYSMMSQYLANTGEHGLYITLEESADSHLNNMKSLGLKLSSNLEISDFTDLRELDEIVEGEDTTDYLHLIEQTIRYFKKRYGDQFTVFTLDSLGALYSLMEDVTGMRKKMFYFFKNLREFNLTSFVVMERSPGTPSDLLGNEGFLVDGIIEMGLDRTRGKLARYIAVEKMRACDHSMEKHTIEVGKDGLTVLGPTLS
jgi:KaiC/GvpD/RAD55 family RecA-like ATPase